MENKIKVLTAEGELNWRRIDPKVHNWKKVDYRKYDFQFLLNGLIQHNIYDLGQPRYLNKLLS